MEELKLDILKQIDEIKQKISQLEKKIEYYDKDTLIEVELELFQTLCNLDECL